MTLKGFTDEEKRERLKQQQKDWRIKNKEYLHEQLKNWRTNNKDRIKIHKETRKETVREYKRKAELYDQLQFNTADHTILTYATSPPERL